MTLAEHYLVTVRETFLRQKTLAERALAQLEDAEFFAVLDPLSNSAAVIVKHLSGNLRSRWRDFLTSDGEKLERDRDAEFERGEETRDELMRCWDAGWTELFGALDELTPDDLLKTVAIRGQEHTVIEAIERALAHAAQHSGQLVLLAKHWRGESWRTLSIPKAKKGVGG